MSNKPPLLFLVHRIPVPPNKGDKIRSFNILKYLNQRFTIYLGCFIDDDADKPHVTELAQYCEEYFVIRKSNRLSKIRGIKGFISNEAITRPYYASRRLQTWVNDIVETKQIQHVFLYSAAVAQFVLHRRDNFKHIVMDYVDVDSDKWRQYAKNKSGLAKWFYEREARLLERYEFEIKRKTNACCFVSQEEAEFFDKRYEKYAHLIGAHEFTPSIGIKNGVDTDYFDPSLFPQDKSNIIGGDYIVFTGAMDYWPNVSAIHWLVDKVWEKVKLKNAEAKLVIVGSNPDKSLLELQSSNVIVTGRVADVRPYIAGAKAAVAPLQIARGIQNKVLEAMAMSKPVVLTSLAGEGISTKDRAGYYVKDEPQAFADSIAECLERDKGTCNQNRSIVINDFSWPSTLKELEKLING